MNEIRVASIAFAAYFVISAEAMSMKMIGRPVRTNGEYSSAITLRAWSDSTPSTTRSGAPVRQSIGLRRAECA